MLALAVGCLVLKVTISCGCFILALLVETPSITFDFSDDKMLLLAVGWHVASIVYGWFLWGVKFYCLVLVYGLNIPPCRIF